MITETLHTRLEKEIAYLTHIMGSVSNALSDPCTVVKWLAPLRTAITIRNRGYKFIP